MSEIDIFAEIGTSICISGGIGESEMKTSELLDRYKKGERNFNEANLSWANLSGANLREADLSGTNLSKANLSGADLSNANLSEANLSKANLSWADLSEANLSWADLSEANLSKADLSGTNLREANLSWANLSGANLREANLSWANLSEANLSWADLSEANLSWANLYNTCLDPNSMNEKISEKELINSGFEIEGDFVIGYRTKQSKFIGNNIYSPGEIHVAPWFSIDVNTECHPGLYFASLKWLKKEYDNIDFVRVAAINGEIIHAQNKWRAKRLMILPWDDE